MPGETDRTAVALVRPASSNLSAGALTVPFVSQWELAAPSQNGSGHETESWARRSCAIACITMVLRYWGVDANLAQVLVSAREAGAWDPHRFWLHAPLVEVLARHGLVACRRNWRLLDGREEHYLAGRAPSDADKELRWVRRQMLNEGLGTLMRLLGEQVPTIISVYRPFDQYRGPGHQIVLIGADDGRLVYHDPAERGSHSAITKEALLRNWKGTALIAVPDGHRSLDLD